MVFGSEPMIIFADERGPCEEVSQRRRERAVDVFLYNPKIQTESQTGKKIQIIKRIEQLIDIFKEGNKHKQFEEQRNLPKFLSLKGNFSQLNMKKFCLSAMRKIAPDRG